MSRKRSAWRGAGRGGCGLLLTLCCILARTREGARVGEPAGVGDLPLVEVPAAAAGGDTLAVILTGGGWAGGPGGGP